jgi:hypothetical protein
MNTRRRFFKLFVGQIGAMKDEFNGVENIPLNRLKELPEHIIAQIEPVFFPEVKWVIRDNILSIPQIKPAKELTLELNDIELKAFEYFQTNLKLKDIANNIDTNSGILFDDIYRNVTSLFFRLASLRICHPKEVYRIDEILKATKK